MKGKDELTDWASKNAGLFEPEDLSRLNDVSNWVNAQTRFDPAHKAAFLDRADPRVISHALANGHTVVTMEVSAPQSTRVKIPDVCSALGVPCQNTFEVLRALGARFVLEVEA